MRAGLGRLPAIDERDGRYLLRPLTSEAKKIDVVREYRYWNASRWWGDQGSTPRCVGYSWAHWLEDGPTTHTPYYNKYKRRPILDPYLIYRLAQRIDEWPGEGYDGTSVRAGAKILKSYGLITEYRWAFDIETLIDTLLHVGPVVVGTWWYSQMFDPDRKTGVIKVAGSDSGGHAYKTDGVNVNQELIRIKNSWGRPWGRNGFAYISFRDMERLIEEDGEVCLAVERRTVLPERKAA